MVVSIIAWIALGLIAGSIVGQLVRGHGEGIPFYVLVGAAGAAFGGSLSNAADSAGVTGFSTWSLRLVIVGAVALAVVWYAVRRSTPTHETHSVVEGPVDVVLSTPKKGAL